MKKEQVDPVGAPAPVGPYSAAVKVGSWVFCSGQIPINPNTGELARGDVREQTAQVLDNLEAVLRGAGLSLDDVVKTTVFLVDLADFEAMNAVYAERFKKPFPARATVQVSALPKGARVEIEATARAGGESSETTGG